MRARELIAEPPQAAKRWPTGLAGLDDVIGGFRQGQLWVLTGAPASGKSMLLLQLAFCLAVEHGFVTAYATTSADAKDLVRARLLSLATARPPSLPDLVVNLDGLSDRQAASLEALRSAEFDVSVGPGFVLPRMDHDSMQKRCFAVDDPEFKRAPVMDEAGRQGLRALADAGALVLATVPRRHCLEYAVTGDRLREEWSAVADLIVEIVPQGMGGATLRLLLNRLGPQAHIEVAVLPHWARFSDSDS